VTAAQRIQAAFGKALRKHREAAGLSQEELASRAGIHRTYIGDVERGKRNVGLVNMQRLADGLDVSLAEIVKDIQHYSRH
jgi:transcriptional regulator with XRE-family HTH domain